MNIMKNIVGDEIKQIINFFIKDEEYGISIENIDEVIRLPKLTKLPRAPKFIKGIINLRGKVVPVIDLRERFGLEENKTNNFSRAIIVDIEDKNIGLIVDKVSKVLNVSSSLIKDIPPVANYIGKEYVKYVVNIDERLIVVLDTVKLLSYSEITQLNDISDK